MARSSHNIIAINQLAMTLKALEFGISGRSSAARNDDLMRNIDDLYDRCLAWADDFMPAARDEYNDLMAGELDNADLPAERENTMAFNATFIRIVAGCYFEWTNRESTDQRGNDWMPLAEFLRTACLKPGVERDSLLVDAGVVSPGGTSPVAQRQVLRFAVDYITRLAGEELSLEQ